MRPPEKIAILGAGLMGHGIAQVFAVAGHEVVVYDPAPASLETLQARIANNLTTLGITTGAEKRVRGTESLPAAVRNADFIIEAVFEDLAVKQALFAQVEEHAGQDAIIATNTSVMPVTQIMSELKYKRRALGTHWWNPPFLVPLVEVIGTEFTATEKLMATMDLLRSVGKTVVHVKKDVPGFIGNRLQHALWREAISLVEKGICSAEDVDTVVKSSFGIRLGVLGPLENADLVGTDLTLSIHRTVLADIESRPGPSPYLEALVSQGALGMKTGLGFKRWSEKQISEMRVLVFKTLQNIEEQNRVK